MNSIYALDDDRAQADFYEKHWPASRKPTFPYVTRLGGVELPLGLVFRRRHVTTRGFDPYAGEEWTLKSRNFSVRLSTVMACMFEVKFFGLTFSKYGIGWEETPWYCRRLFEFLDYRFEWHEHNEYVEDPYADAYGCYE